MIGACSLSEMKTKMPFLHPIISPKTKVQKNEKNNLQGRERSNVFQNPATELFSFNFYTTIHERVVNTMQLGRKYIHPSTYF